MGSNTSQIIIMTHGKNQSLTLSNKEQITSTGNGLTNKSKSEALDVSKLSNTNFDPSNVTLSLYSCHSSDYIASPHGNGDHSQGRLSGSKQPIAEAFETKFNFKYVKGTDGAVNYHSIFDQTIPGSIEYLKPYPESGNWFYTIPEVIIYGEK